MLHGRDEERAQLSAMLDAARQGRATSLVVRAGAGMGKTALLEDTAQRASDTTVLRTAGLQSEEALAFAALHRLLRPAMSAVASLPPPQQQALRTAFGEEDGARFDPFLVGVATLGLLTEIAESGPVLCLIDDAQWLDAASAGAVLFAARRLLAEPVTMIFAARDDADYVAPTDIPELVLSGLSTPAVRSLLTERSGHDPADHVLAELAARTGGNPLALFELPTHLSPEQLGGTSALPTTIPLSARVERVFLDRCRRLSTSAQTLMLLASADDSVRLAVLLRAGGALAVPVDTLTEVESAGLLVTDGDAVRVRHPLVRSAIYQAATASERRAAHAALADALGSIEDRDRRAWHRASAADGPDNDVAADLDESGARAAVRGGYDAAAKAYERSAELSAGDAPRARRLFMAARNAYAAGRTERAETLLKASRAVADDPALRASIDRLRGRIEVASGSAVDAHRIFINAAREVAQADPVQAVELAAMAGVLRSHGVDSGARLPAGVVSADVAPEDSPRLQCLKLLLAATDREAEDDWVGATTILRTALANGMSSEDRDVWANLGNMALHLGDEATHRTLFTAMLAGARADGAVMEVLYALHRLCLSQYAVGDWSGVRRSADEAVALARSLGQPAQTVAPLAWLTLLAALQGRDDYASLLKRASELLNGRRIGVMDAFVADLLHWSQATEAAQSGDWAQSFHHVNQMHPGVVTRLAAAPRIMAAAQASRHDRAEEWTSELVRLAALTKLPWVEAVACYGRALVNEGEDASAAFEAALKHHEAAHRPYDGALAQLAYGELLRRAGRRVDARTHLKTALETFRDLEAEPLAERAANELRASGETARKRDPSTSVDLTPTELRIAELVSQGLSNKEVAAQCWVSPRTVAFHLRNVFAKTGVTSRGELAQLTLG